MKKEIDIIKLDETIYDRLYKDRINEGGEAIIYKTNNNTLYKIFVNSNKQIISMPQNKIDKIKYLYQHNIPYLVKPLSLLSYNNQVIGYEMSYNKQDISIDNQRDIKRKTIISILKKVAIIIKELSLYNITYGDITENNILYNKDTKEIKLCDIDNIKIKDYKIDVMGYSLSKYYSINGLIDINSDIFMHNLLTLRILSYNYDYDSNVLVSLKKEYPKKYKLSAYPIFRDIVNISSNSNLLIEHIKR